VHMAAEIARHHHERFDGAGYPDGLRGTDIPLAARIVAVADVVDALTSERVKRPMPFADSIEEIKRCAGTQFDPAVVEAFLSRMEDLRWHTRGSRMATSRRAQARSLWRSSCSGWRRRTRSCRACGGISAGQINSPWIGLPGLTGTGRPSCVETMVAGSRPIAAKRVAARSSGRRGSRLG
jgi:hypothetical protein